MGGDQDGGHCQSEVSKCGPSCYTVVLTAAARLHPAKTNLQGDDAVVRRFSRSSTKRTSRKQRTVSEVNLRRDQRSEVGQEEVPVSSRRLLGSLPRQSQRFPHHVQLEAVARAACRARYPGKSACMSPGTSIALTLRMWNDSPVKIHSYSKERHDQRQSHQQLPWTPPYSPPAPKSKRTPE